ncbi:nuclear envelope integral membrane protein-like isoform X1 [Daphnia carinata]|uniref:nuclear envelope integral membrane protein-like isoform X1 n=1 Tax=Daphnia carinata TaxID=120202 RepID=UPI00257C2826|nr:nuclear envelope integral membrane protein-like isoform X1 [Daphnia carinata]
MAPNTKSNAVLQSYIGKTVLSCILIPLLFSNNVFCAIRAVQAGNAPHQYNIKPANVYQVSNNRSESLLTIFCWTGDPKTVFGLWRTVTVYLTIEDEDFYIYKGENASHVVHLHQSLQQSWFPFLPWKEKSISVSPFNMSCIGVFSQLPYSLRLDLRQINFNRLVMFAIGILIFIVAPSLCKKVVFHYTTGTLVGVLGSILIIVYLTSRLIPKKSGAYAVLIGGSSIVFYLLRSLWENLYSVLREYHYYVIAYLAASSAISFAFCYRFGPVTNTRTIHLLQWGIQLCGLCLVFESSEHKEGAMAIILVTVVSHNFPGSWWARCRTLWYQRFPPKMRILTEDEYVEQARIETDRGLKELREFSKSPNCNAWKTITRLKDPLRVRAKPSPRCVEFVSTPPKNNQNRRLSRFAEFVEGKSHLSDREVLNYETTAYRETETWTDDESDEE